jgi:HEAT repeat protein
MNRFALVLSCVLLGAAFAFAQPPALDLKGKPLAATFNELLPGMEKADNAAQQRWQDLCNATGAPGNEKVRAEACTLMAAKLDAKTPAPARLWLLTQLERIGREESVAAVGAILDDKDDVVREAAVRALANNPSPKATAPLTAALKSASGQPKIGLLNALGHRADATVVAMVEKELTSTDEPTAVAAARALGRTPGADALTALTAAKAKSKGSVRKALADALIAHADRLRKTDSAAAAKIYAGLNSPDEPKPVRFAAVRGIIQTAGDKAGELILKILSGEDAGEKAVAVGQIETLTAGALKSLAGSLDKLTSPNQAAVVTAIAARGDRTQASVVLTAAKSTDAEVKRAGILALGRLGDATAVEFLLDAMSGKDATAGNAAESLAALTADGVNEKLIAVLKAEKTAARTLALIGVLERRKATAAVPELLTAAGSADESVRRAAFAGLKTLAAPAVVPDMLSALVKTKGAEREQAELAVVTVSAQTTAEKRAEPVLSAIKKDAKLAPELLPLLGRLGGPDALKVVRDAVAGTDAALRADGVVGLCNWPDGGANSDLLALAEKGRTDAEKQRAIQALIRVNAVLTDRTPEERLAALETLKKAMKLATHAEERRALLEGIGFVRHIDTLRFVVPYLEDKALAQSACKGVVELAHSKTLREPNKEEFRKALDRVIALGKDKALVERAKQYKDGR